MRIDPKDLAYRSKAGFWHVWKLKNSYGIYNQSGVKVATIHCNGQRQLDLAKLAADAFEKRFQW